MDALLRERVNDEPLDPHTPVTLKPALLTLTPEQRAGRDLPEEPADARRDHDEKHHLHPWRDVAEDFAGRVVRIDRNHRNRGRQLEGEAPRRPDFLARPAVVAASSAWDSRSSSLQAEIRLCIIIPNPCESIR